MESVPPNMTSLGTSTTNTTEMDVRSFFGRPTATTTETKTKTEPFKPFWNGVCVSYDPDTETKTKTKTYPMSLTTEKIVEHMCRTNRWALRNGPRHNWFVIKGKKLYIDEKEGCRIVCANKAFEARVSQAFKVAWDDLTPPEEEDEIEDAITTCEGCGYKGDSVIVHDWGCVALCETCSMENGEPHCPRTSTSGEAEQCEWCQDEWREIDGEEKDEEDEPEECNQCNVELDGTTGRGWIEQLGCLCMRCYDLRKGDFPDGV